MVGFDGLPDAAYFWPSLTTVYHNQHELGCTAVSRVSDLVEDVGGGDSEARIIWLQPELIVRESSGQPVSNPFI